jgi:hypothetical protein
VKFLLLAPVAIFGQSFIISKISHFAPDIIFLFIISLPLTTSPIIAMVGALECSLILGFLSSGKVSYFLPGWLVSVYLISVLKNKGYQFTFSLTLLTIFSATLLSDLVFLLIILIFGDEVVGWKEFFTRSFGSAMSNTLLGMLLFFLVKNITQARSIKLPKLS